jgi:hypothetical protein
MKSNSLIPPLIARFTKQAFLAALLFSAVGQSPANQVTAPTLTVSELAVGALEPEMTVPFGTLARSHTSTPKKFQLANNGSAALTVSQIRFVGGNASDFRVGAVTLPLVIEQGNTAEIEVTARPGATGMRTTVMQLVSNHLGTPGTVFPLTLTANGVPGVSVGFAAKELNLNQTATSVTLTVKRLTATLAQTVRLRTVNGVGSSVPYFEGAVAGVDYTPVDQVVNFGVGQLSRTVTIQLAASSQADVANRRFTAVLSEPTGGAVLQNATVLMNLRATDATKPILTVSFPTAETTAIDAAANPVVTVQGTVTDAKGISRLTISHNNSISRNLPITVNPVTTGEETVPGDSRDISFSAPITARLGSNKIVIRASDVRGNVSVVTRVFNYTGGVPVTVERVVPGSVSSKPGSAGSMRIKADPVSHVTPLVATSNVRIQQCLAVPNATLTLTAIPAANHAFSHFENLPAGAQVVGATAVFAMPATPAAVRAHFVAQTYTAPTGYGDSFQGLVKFDQAAEANAEKVAGAVTSGMVSATMTSRGAFSGTIQIDQSKQSFTGQAYADGRVTLGLSASTQGESITVGQHVFSMSYDAADRKMLVVNAVHAPTSTHSKGYLRRAFYSAARKVPTSLRGYYTVRIAGDHWHFHQGSETRPGGLGFASFSLSETGVATVTAELPDGSKFTCKTILVDHFFDDFGEMFVSGNASMPVYAQVKPVGVSSSAPSGAYFSQWFFTRMGANPEPHEQDSDLHAFWNHFDEMHWFRPAYAGNVAYAAGWPSGMNVWAVGNRYNRTLTSQQALGAPAPNAQNGNVWINLGGGKLSGGDLEGIHKTFNVAANTITQAGGSDSAFKLTISPTTGLVTGSFRPNWQNPSSTHPTFRGMIQQPVAAQSWKPSAYGRFQSNIVGDSAPQIGWFNLHPSE